MDKQKTDKLIQFLREGGFLTEEQISEVLSLAKSSKTPIEDIIISKGFMTDEHLGRLVADANGWNYVRIAKVGVDSKVMSLIPEAVAKKQMVLAFGETDDGKVKVAMQNPDDVTLIHLIQKRAEKKVAPYYATASDISAKFKLYKEDISNEFEKISQAAAKKTDDESVTIKIADLLLTRAFESNASDIHIEPYVKQTTVRFRIDGVMHEVLNLPKASHDALVSRFKVLANLHIDEHQKPQDGKIQYQLNGNKFDVRVSVAPTIRGENVVMRLLSDTAKEYTLESLGLNGKDLEKVKEAIKRPWGMILATGPTGSGKTTSLYSILKLLNRKEVNIATIEDPVEYHVEEITQIQVNPKADLTFASGLRSIVRQDPDIIMVGEIRDKDTADIAVNSAMTGHLVLSTLHTNDASTTIPRLLEMDVEPFLVSSTVNIAIAQRLMRKVCPHCIQSYTAEKEALREEAPAAVLDDLFSDKDSITLFKGKGCDVCNHTGYAGRTGVFEVLEIDSDIRKLITDGATAEEIKKKAVENGMTTMYENAKKKVLNGETTIEEMIRVVKQ